MTINLNVTRYALSLGSRDAVTGWRNQTWTEETLDPFYTESKGVNSETTRLAGAYASQDAVGLSYDRCSLLDLIETYNGKLYQVIGVDQKDLADSYLWTVHQLKELPLWQTPPELATLFTNKVSPGDPRSRTKLFLDEFILPANFIDQYGLTVNVPVIFAEPPYPVESEFRAASNPVAGLILVGEPANAEPLWDYVGNKPYSYKETIPITTAVMDGTYIRGTAFKWRVEAELRRVFEENPTSGSFRNLTKRNDKTMLLGKEIMYQTEWQFDYIRELDYNSPLKLSWGHGWLTDCDDVADWALQQMGGIQNVAFTPLYDDYFKLSGTLQDIIDEKLYAERNIEASGISTTLYPTVLTRWKTSAAANGLGAQVQLVYTDATTQYLLGGNASDSTPQFSTSWKTTTTTLLPGKTIQKIRFYADDWPDSATVGAHQVYFDFLLFCRGIMTFPYVNEAYEVNLPEDHRPKIPIINRVGDVTQWTGQGLATVHARGTMDTRVGWKGPNSIVGEALLSMKHQTSAEPFQWFADGRYKFKVTPETPFNVELTAKAEGKFDLIFAEYRKSNAQHEEYHERFGLI